MWFSRSGSEVLRLQEFVEGMCVMLVLSRHKNESVIIGDGIVEVMVVEIRGDKVRLGFNAPSDIPVHRKEVQDAINREAKRSKGDE